MSMTWPCRSNSAADCGAPSGGGGVVADALALVVGVELADWEALGDGMGVADGTDSEAIADGEGLVTATREGVEDAERGAGEAADSPPPKITMAPTRPTTSTAPIAAMTAANGGRRLGASTRRAICGRLTRGGRL